MTDATALELTDKQVAQLEVALTDKETAKILIDKINEIVAALATKADA